jgi:hypothetical protein
MAEQNIFVKKALFSWHFIHASQQTKKRDTCIPAVTLCCHMDRSIGRFGANIELWRNAESFQANKTHSIENEVGT